MRLYPGPGFFTGLVLLATYAVASAGMAVGSVLEQFWLGAALAFGIAWLLKGSFSSFYAWYSIRPHSGVQVGSGGMEYDNRLRLCTSIAVIAVGLRRVRKSVNFVTAGMDHAAAARIAFRDGTEMLMRAGQGPFTTFAPGGKDLGKADVDAFLQKIALISAFARLEPQVVGLEEVVR